MNKQAIEVLEDKVDTLREKIVLLDRDLETNRRELRETVNTILLLIRGM